MALVKYITDKLQYFPHRNPDFSTKLSLYLFLTASSYKLSHTTLFCEAIKMYFQGRKMTPVSQGRQRSESPCTPYGCYTWQQPHNPS